MMIHDLDMARFRKLSQVHVEGSFIGLQKAVAQMRAQSGGAPATGSRTAASASAAKVFFKLVSLVGWALRTYSIDHLLSIIRALMKSLIEEGRYLVGIAGDLAAQICPCWTICRKSLASPAE